MTIRGGDKEHKCAHGEQRHRFIGENELGQHGNISFLGLKRGMYAYGEVS